MVEGQYYITDTAKRAKIFGVNALEESQSTFKVDIRMKEAGKIAWTTLDELVKSFGCGLSEAIKNSDIICKMMEIQKHNRNNLCEMSRTLKIEDLHVLKKLG